MVPSNILQRTLSATSTLQVMNKSTWWNVDFSDMWYPPSGADVALLSLKQQLSPAHAVGVSDGKGFYLSQQIYFLGFPFGLRMEAGAMNNDFPIPFVKTGIIANFSTSQPGGQLIYCDGHNNPGFSGGPIVTMSGTNQATVIAVVSGYHYDDDEILLNGKSTGLTYSANSGLVIGYGLSEILERIATAPTGALLAQQGA